MASEHDGGRLLWFLAGAAVGAAAALLYAPQSGRDTRRYIRKKADEGREALADAGKGVLERGREVYEKGREIAEEAGEMLERGRKLVTG
jgi:gas vesicle protein